jgi:hypothetical protein
VQSIAKFKVAHYPDFAAYAVYRWYEHGDGSFLKKIQHKFCHQGRRVHGLKCYPLESTKAYSK